MAHKQDRSLVVEINSQMSKPFIVFECESEEDLDKLSNAWRLNPPVFVRARHLRIFYGNAVIVAEDKGL